jgi:cell division protein ZapA
VSAEQVTVRIYGETYPLRTEASAARLEELARLVDLRMREVAASGRVVVTSKIAVLAALHIADELFRVREERDREPAPEEERAQPRPEALPATDTARIEALVARLDAVLAPPAETREH